MFNLTEVTRIWSEGESWKDSESLWPQFNFFLSAGWTPSPPTCNPKKAQTLIATRSRVFWVYRPVKIQRARSPAAAISASHTAGQAPSTPPPLGCTCPWASSAGVWCDEGHPALCSVPRGQSCWRSRKSSACVALKCNGPLRYRSSFLTLNAFIKWTNATYLLLYAPANWCPH